MESLNIIGTITIYEGTDKKKVVNQYKNKFLNTGKQRVLNLLWGFPPATNGYTHLVIGTGNNPVIGTDTRLYNETFRKPISKISVVDATRILIDTFIDVNEANFFWGELGLVADGTDSINSGALLNRALINENKNSGKTFTISWEISVE